MGRTLKKPNRSENKEAALSKTFTPRFWEHCDLRLAVVRSMCARYEALRESCGGYESTQRDLLVRRIAFLSIQIETMEVNAMEGKPFDAGSYVQCLNSFLGFLKSVGLDRRAKNVTDLNRYLEEKKGRAG